MLCAICTLGFSKKLKCHSTILLLVDACLILISRTICILKRNTRCAEKNGSGLNSIQQINGGEYPQIFEYKNFTICRTLCEITFSLEVNMARQDCSTCRMDAVKCSNLICSECFESGDPRYPYQRNRWKPRLNTMEEKVTSPNK